ncbi:MAG: Lpg1974 family pore-forming outer membrane protein [Pirellulales bacterium]
MSLTHRCGHSTRALGALLVLGLLAGFARAETPDSPAALPWTVHRPNTSQRLPLARLIRNPDESGAGPQYALADQAGNIQRYVEPVPGIDLEPYVGYAVKVRHDTGHTLLASQLELPGQEAESILDDSGAADDTEPTPRAESLFRGLLDAPSATAGSPYYSTSQNGQSLVQPAQYVQGPGSPVVIQQGVPMQQGMPIEQGMPPMMGPQGMTTYDPSMGGMPMGAVPAGDGSVYLDGPMPCGPQGCPQPCPQPQMYMQPCPQPVVACPPPPQPLRWSIWGEALWLHPTGVDMAHAQQQDGLGGAGTVPFGLIGVLDPNYELGFRAGAQLRFAPKDAVFGQFTWFQSSVDDSLAAPNIPGGGGAIGSLVHHPGAALTASAGPLTGSYDIDFQLGDLAYRYYVACTRTGEVSVFIGGRYGKLQQEFAQSGIFGGGLGGEIDTTTDVDFTGGGPIAGFQAEHLLDATRFSVYAKGLVAALAGSFDSTYLMFNDSTDQTLAQSIWSDDRIVPMLEYELGVMWTGPQNHCRVALGYMASYWFNIVSTPVWVKAVQADNYVNVHDTLAFDGAVGRVEFRW